VVTLCFQTLMAIQRAYQAYQAWVFVTYRSSDPYDSETWKKVRKQVASDDTLAGEFIRTYWMLANNQDSSANTYVRQILKNRGYGYTPTSSPPLLSHSVKKTKLAPHSTASPNKPQSRNGRGGRVTQSPSRQTAEPAPSETTSSVMFTPTSSSDHPREALLPSSKLERDPKSLQTPLRQDTFAPPPAPSQSPYLHLDGHQQGVQREANTKTRFDLSSFIGPDATHLPSPVATPHSSAVRSVCPPKIGGIAHDVDGMNQDKGSITTSKTGPLSYTTPPRASSAPSARIGASSFRFTSTDTERKGASCYPSPISPQKVAGSSRGSDISWAPARIKEEPPHETHSTSTLSVTGHRAYNASISSTQPDVAQHTFTGGLASEVSFVQQALVYR
jgi:hypothetical protein